jgi:hypothetical protein
MIYELMMGMALFIVLVLYAFSLSTGVFMGLAFIYDIQHGEYHEAIKCAIIGAVCLIPTFFILGTAI